MPSVAKTSSAIIACAGVAVLAVCLPDPLMRDGVKWAHRIVFSGGIFSAILFKLFESVKGDTKKLLERESLTGPQQMKLAKAIHRRSRFLWQRFGIVLVLTAASYGCLYFHRKGYFPHYLLRASFVLVCLAIGSVIPVILAWRDYVVTKERLDNRDCGIPDTSE